MRKSSIGLIVLLGSIEMLAQLRAEARFNVYCINNSDGTNSCQGWDGNLSLNCTASRGGVMSCATSTGKTFTCVSEADGNSSCDDHTDQHPGEHGSNCSFTGNGNFSCAPAERPEERPVLIDLDQPVITTPEPVKNVIEIPSVFRP